MLWSDSPISDSLHTGARAGVSTCRRIRERDGRNFRVELTWDIYKPIFITAALIAQYEYITDVDIHYFVIRIVFIYCYTEYFVAMRGSPSWKKLPSVSQNIGQCPTHVLFVMSGIFFIPPDPGDLKIKSMSLNIPALHLTAHAPCLVSQYKIYNQSPFPRLLPIFSHKTSDVCPQVRPASPPESC